MPHFGCSAVATRPPRRNYFTSPEAARMNSAQDPWYGPLHTRNTSPLDGSRCTTFDDSTAQTTRWFSSAPTFSRPLPVAYIPSYETTGGLGCIVLWTRTRHNASVHSA